MTDKWERVGRDLAARDLYEERYALDDEVCRVIDLLRDGEEITRDDLNDLRGALYTFERIVEETLGPLADGTTAWASQNPDRPHGKR